MARLVKALALFLLLLSQVSAASDYFLSITDRNNALLLTSPDGAPKNAPKRSVQISSMSFSTSTPIDAATGGATGKFRSTALTVNRTADANSAVILQQQITNSVLRSVVITGLITNSAGALDIQQTYTLTNAIISAFEQGPISANGLLQESISFSFQKFELKSGTASAIFDSVGA